MQIANTDKSILTNNMGGQTYGVEFNGMLFHTLTASLYKDKPRAVCREEIANAVDAHRERNHLYSSCYDFETKTVTDETKYNELRAAGYADPSVGWSIHIPTEIEPWLIFKDNGLGLRVDQILGKPVLDDEGRNLKNPDGSLIRSGGVYTTLFGSDKRENNRAIGAYGLGCKSPYSISDTFLVSSIVGGEKHQFLMYLNSNREPMVDWLTKDDEWNPAPILVDEPNGVEVRIDGIPYRMIEKLRVSVSEILQTFPLEEQPTINGGYYSFTPLEKTPFTQNTDIVLKAHYGNVFNNILVVNTGGVVYPIDSNKYDDFGDLEIITKFVQSKYKCLMLNMPLGSVNIPPSREEISYDEHTIENIKTVIQEVEAQIKIEIEKYIESVDIFSFVSVNNAFKRLGDIIGKEKAWEVVKEKLDSQRSANREKLEKLGFKIEDEIGGQGVQLVVPLKDGIEYGIDFKLYSKYWGVSQGKKFSSSDTRDLFWNNKKDMYVSESMRENLAVVFVDDGTKKQSLLSRINSLQVNTESFRIDKHNLVIVGTDREDGIHSIGKLEEFASIFCRLAEVDYILSSEINEEFNILKKTLQTKNRINSSEVDRNVRVWNVDSAYWGLTHNSKETPVQFYEFGDEELEPPYFYASIDAWEKLPEKVTRATKFHKECFFNALGTTKLFFIKGVRTQSRMKFDKSDNTILLDEKQILEIFKKSNADNFNKTLEHVPEILERIELNENIKLPNGVLLEKTLPQKMMTATHGVIESLFHEENRHLLPLKSVRTWGVGTVFAAALLQTLLGGEAETHRLEELLKRVNRATTPDNQFFYSKRAMLDLGVDLGRITHFLEISNEINCDPTTPCHGRNSLDAKYCRNKTKVHTFLNVSSYGDSGMMDTMEFWLDAGHQPSDYEMETIKQLLQLFTFFGITFRGLKFNLDRDGGMIKKIFSSVDEEQLKFLGANITEEVKKIEKYTKKTLTGTCLGSTVDKLTQSLGVSKVFKEWLKTRHPLGRSHMDGNLLERVKKYNNFFTKQNALSLVMDEDIIAKPIFEDK